MLGYTDNNTCLTSRRALEGYRDSRGCTWGNKKLRLRSTSRDACGVQRRWEPVRGTKSVGYKEVKSKRRRWREEQLDGLNRRAKARIVRKKDGRYEEKQGNAGVICFSIIEWPVCTMLFVHGVFSFAFPCGFCVELDILCMISVLGTITEFLRHRGPG